MGKAINYRGEAITEFIFDTAPAHRELKGLYAAASRLRTEDMGEAAQSQATHDKATRDAFNTLETEIKENPEIVAQLILAVQSGYDINDHKDIELFCDETNNLTTFSDLKPYAVRKAVK